jgi:flagellum-specific peptidoglycan hydrolase FlgJ
MVFSWNQFVSAVSTAKIEAPDLKKVYLAQCMLESGHGTSLLFTKLGNPTGLKWRDELQAFANKKFLITPTEPEGAYWCSWKTPEDAVNGYWKFISRSPYAGWQQHKNDPLGYLKHIHSCGYATDENYVKKVSGCFKEAENLLKETLGNDENRSDFNA